MTSRKPWGILLVLVLAPLLLSGCCGPWRKASASAPAAAPMKKHERLTLHLGFEAGQATIKAEDYDRLNGAIDFIRKFPGASIVVEGHTDNAGTREHNHDLSHKRADAVKKYIVVHGGFEEARIKTIGYGESRPVASNDTPEGRDMNRRVELLVFKE